MQSRPSLHHVSIVTADLGRSVAFYRDVLGLRQVTRPPFRLPGAWLTAGTLDVHITANPQGTFRGRKIVDRDDIHFAIRVTDFEATVAALEAAGYRADSGNDDAKALLIDRNSIAGFPQVYLIDPDGNVIEINAAPAGA